MIDIYKRARFVIAIDTPGFVNCLHDARYRDLSLRELMWCLYNIAYLSKPYMPDVPNPEDRMQVSLRLWSGCIIGAKTIALATRGGAVTPDDRRVVSYNVNQLSTEDRVFRAGIEAAPFFKQIRKERISFRGVPKGSVIRNYRISNSTFLTPSH